MELKFPGENLVEDCNWHVTKVPRRSEGGRIAFFLLKKVKENCLTQRTPIKASGGDSFWQGHRDMSLISNMTSVSCCMYFCIFKPLSCLEVDKTT